MNLEEFGKYLDTITCSMYIVNIHADDHYLNEIIYWDDGMWVWDSDWNEGYKNIEILGLIETDEVIIPEGNFERYQYE